MIRVRALAAVAALFGIAPGAAAQLPLIPKPREVVERPGFPLRGGVSIIAGGSSEDRFAARDLAHALRERGVRVVSTDGAVRVRLARVGTPAASRVPGADTAFRDPAMRREGYLLVAERGRVDIVAASAAGIFYGVQTLKQLVEGRGPNARLRGARIRDWPALRWRGIHDDLSRGPIPTLEFQKAQIRRFAAYKLNVYSPYFEHTLAYAAHPVVPPPGGAMTPEEVRELVAYAKQYHIVVIPEQEAFGHLHHVLRHEMYSSLGETPHGHVLAPGDSATLPLIAGWFAELDSLFPGPFVHIGADETFELGRGRTASEVAERGLGAVYLDFLTRIEQAIRRPGKRLLFWGDMAMHEPELVRSLPKDMIAVAWNYSARDGFDRYLTPFRDAGIETWVAPGVNNWNRVYPNYDVALPNIHEFVRAGERLGATGVLNTTWDDDGEALFNQTWYGVVFGAAASWEPDGGDVAAFQAHYGRVVYGDTTGGIDEAERHLAAAHALLARSGVGDASDYLFWVDPWSEEGMQIAARIRPVTRELRLLAEGAIAALARAQRTTLRDDDAVRAIELGARRIDLIGMKFQFADEVVSLYARAMDAVSAGARPVNELSSISGINGRLQDLRDAYGLLRNLYEQAWLCENRRYWLDNVLARYDMAMQQWIARADRVAAARRSYDRTRHLPPADSVGIPTTMPGLAER